MVAVGDLNNDNRSDLVVSNFAKGNVGIFLGTGSGTFLGPETFLTGAGSAPTSVAIGDFNNDNKLDLAITNYMNDSVGILLSTCDCC